MRITAIIAAGGRGRRFGGAQPKQLCEVGGESILERSVRAFASHPDVDEIVVAVPQEVADALPAYLRSVRSRGSAAAPPAGFGGERVSGGRSVERRHRDSRRRASVRERRPHFADDRGRGRERRRAGGAAGARHRQADRRTRRRRVGAANCRRASIVQTVAETIPRETIFLAQTPQAFRRAVLADALNRPTTRPTRRCSRSAPATRCGSSTARRRTSRSRRPTISRSPRRSHARSEARCRGPRGRGARAPATTCIDWSRGGR